MLTFPYTASADSPSEGMTLTTAFPVEIVESRTGVEQRRALSIYPRHSVEIRWSRDMNAASRVDAIWDFYRQTRGRLLPFVYFDFDSARVWTRAYVGLGTGSQTVFDLPSKSATSVTVYVDGVATAGTFAEGAGNNGRDRFTFGTAPASGAVIEASFTGRRAFTMRFADEALSYSAFSNLLYEIGMTLVEVRGES